MNIKKKLTAAISAAVVGVSSLCMNSFAFGDLLGVAYHSHIYTYINNYPILAYNMNGSQFIVAEDLRNYGFTVDWDGNARTLSINPDYSVGQIIKNDNIKIQKYKKDRRAYNIVSTDIRVFLCGKEIESFSADGQMLIKIRSLGNIPAEIQYNHEKNFSRALVQGLPMYNDGDPIALEEVDTERLVVVIDAGHGKSSGKMSYDEKINEGYIQSNGRWGEWRHFKAGSVTDECWGSGCNKNHQCFYPMGNGDRNTEPELNLQNALAAKRYLESELGYTVRLTRNSNEQNPSFTKRVSYCYPNNDPNSEPDAACYICLHSNAGGGRGTAYIGAESSSNYNQKYIDKAYVAQSNELGEAINNQLVADTPLSKHGSGRINGQGWLILFNKAPVPTAYMEIGFFDSSDLGIIKSNHDKIGKAIASGLHNYMLIK